MKKYKYQMIILTICFIVTFPTACYSKVLQTNTKIDTVFNDVYFFTYTVNSKSEIFYIGENNNLRQLIDGVLKNLGKIPYFYYPDGLYIDNHFISVITLDTLSLYRLFILYNRDEISEVIKIKSVAGISFNLKLMENGKILIDEYNETNLQGAFYIYDVNTSKKEQIQNWSSSYILSKNNLFVLNYPPDYFKCKKKFSVDVEKINLEKNLSQNFEIVVNPNSNLLYLLEDKYIGTIDSLNEMWVFISDYKGNILSKWKIEINTSGYQVVLTSGKIELYNWQNTDNENLVKYYFVRQEIDLSEFLTDQEKKLQEKIK